MEYTIRTEIGASSLLLSTLFQEKKRRQKKNKKKKCSKGKGKGRGHSVMFRVLYEDGLEKRGKKKETESKALQNASARESKSKRESAREKKAFFFLEEL